jgi:hypothetical protein
MPTVRQSIRLLTALVVSVVGVIFVAHLTDRRRAGRSFELGVAPLDEWRVGRLSYNGKLRIHLWISDRGGVSGGTNNRYEVQMEALVGDGEVSSSGRAVFQVLCL